MQTGHLRQCASSKSNSHLLAAWPTYLCMQSTTEHACGALFMCAQAATEIAFIFDFSVSQIACLLSVVDPTCAWAQASSLCSKLVKNGHAIPI